MSNGGAAEVRADLRRRIAAGEYGPGDKLPRLRDLMTTYGVRSRSTMDRVLRELAAEGLVTLVQGSGIYVRRRRVVRRDLVAGIRLEYQRAKHGDVRGGLFEATTGATDVEVTVTYDRVDPPERVAAALGKAAGASVLKRTFRYTVGGTPHQIATSYLPIGTADAAGLIDPDSEQRGSGTIAQLLRAGVAVDHVTVAIETRPPSATEAVELAIPPGTPVFDHLRIMYAAGRPVEVSTAVVPGDSVAYVLDVDLTDEA